MHLALTLVTPPAVEPVSLATAKNFLRVDFTEDDALITALITAAREWAEGYTHRAFFSQTWTRSLDNFPLWWNPNETFGPSRRAEWPNWSSVWELLRIDLPKAKTQSVTSIVYYSPDAGKDVTLDTSTYQVDESRMPCCIVPANGTFWPIETLYQPGGVVVTYVAGSFGDGVETNTIPQTICIAILLLINHWYNNRESVGSQLSEAPLGVKSLLNQHKLRIFGYR